MKKLFMLVAVMSMATAASSQVKETGKVVLDVDNLQYIPGDFSSNRKPLFVDRKRDAVDVEGEIDVSENVTYTIYDDNINKVKTITVNDCSREYIIGSQTKIKHPLVTITGVNSDIRNSWSLTWEEAQAWIEEQYGDEYVWKQDYQYWPRTDISNPQYHSDIVNAWTAYYYDYKYPTSYVEWNPENGHVYWVWVNYQDDLDTYIEEWSTTSSYSSRERMVYSIEFWDLDNNAFLESSITLTQTLFNTDNKYEYIMGIWDDSKETINENIYGSSNSRTVTHGGLVGFRIMSEDGSVIQEIRANIDNYIEGFFVIRIGGKLYLLVEQEEGDVFYLIDHEANSVKKVAAIPGMNVRPRVAERNKTITVELGEGSNAREIQVVNAAGQMVKKIPVAKGQRQVTFSTEGMGRGMNVVRGGKNSCKIIVK